MRNFSRLPWRCVGYFEVPRVAGRLVTVSLVWLMLNIFLRLLLLGWTRIDHFVVGGDARWGPGAVSLSLRLLLPLILIHFIAFPFCSLQVFIGFAKSSFLNLTEARVKTAEREGEIVWKFSREIHMKSAPSLHKLFTKIFSSGAKPTHFL